MERGISINTIGKLIEYGETLHVYCLAEGCWHHAQIDLVALAERLGPDHSCMHKDLSPKLKCAKCGAKGPKFSITPPGPKWRGQDRRSVIEGGVDHARQK